MISTEKQWYDIIRECRVWFPRRWQGMAKVRRKLRAKFVNGPAIPVWFDVPDPRFATWIAVKMSLQVHSDAKYRAGK